MNKMKRLLGYTGLLVSLREWSHIFTHNHLIVFGDKSTFPTMRSAVMKGPTVLSSASPGASGKTQYHAIWHSIIKHISPFPEREWWQSPHFTSCTHQSFREIFWYIYIPVKHLGLWRSWDVVKWSGGLGGGGKQWSCDGHWRNTLHCSWIVTFYSVTFSTGRKPRLITFYLLCHCVSFTYSFTGWLGQRGRESNSWHVREAWADDQRLG